MHARGPALGAVLVRQDLHQARANLRMRITRTGSSNEQHDARTATSVVVVCGSVAVQGMSLAPVCESCDGRRIQCYAGGCMSSLIQSSHFTTFPFCNGRWQLLQTKTRSCQRQHEKAELEELHASGGDGGAFSRVPSCGQRSCVIN